MLNSERQLLRWSYAVYCGGEPHPINPAIMRALHHSDQEGDAAALRLNAMFPEPQ